MDRILSDLQARYAAKVNEAKPLAIKSREGRLSADENARFDTIVNELNGIKGEVEARKAQIEAANAIVDAAEPGRALGAAVGLDPELNERLSGVAAADYNIGRAFATSEQRRNYAAQPAGASPRFGIGSTRRALLAEHRAGQGGGADETRALVYTGGFANYLRPNRLPGNENGLYTAMYEQPRVRDMFVNGRTDSPTVEYVRKGTTTNNAAEVAEPATVAGATAKPESAIALTVVSTTVKTIAHSMPVTRQMLQDAGQIEAFINAELLRGLEEREDRQLILGDGTGANLTGLFATSGINLLDSAYWTANPLPDGANELDRLRRAMTIIRLNGGTPSFFAVNPSDLEVWSMLKDANGQYLLRGAGPDGDGVTTLWRVPVVENKDITAGQVAAGDGRFAIVLDKMDGEIFMTDSHSDWFLKNLIAILAESRLAFAVPIPSVFARVYVR